MSGRVGDESDAVREDAQKVVEDVVAAYAEVTEAYRIAAVTAGYPPGAD